MFRFGSLKEGAKIIVDDKEGMLVKIGTQETIIALYTDKGLVWRYVPNTRIPMLNLSKVVDSELHQDSKIEKATKIKRQLIRQIHKNRRRKRKRKRKQNKQTKKKK